MAATLVPAALLAWSPQPVLADTNHDAAKAHFRIAMKHFDQREYDAAIVEYKQAYQFDHNSIFIFNIAQSYRLKSAISPTHNDCSSGVSFYKQYLDATPAAQDRAEVQAWIAQLQACVDALPATPVVVAPVVNDPVAPSTVTPPSPLPDPAANNAVQPIPPPTHQTSSSEEEPGRDRRIAGIAIGSVGVASLVVGSYFAAHANSVANSLATLCAVSANCVWSPALRDEQNDLSSSNTRAWISFGVGGVAVVAGTALYVWGKLAGRDESSVAFVPTNGGAMMVTGGSF